LAEGSGRPTYKDKVRFYHIALGSLRECQAAIDLAPRALPALAADADRLGAHLYKLCNQKAV
jgi:four helix bundle protein